MPSENLEVLDGLRIAYSISVKSVGESLSISFIVILLPERIAQSCEGRSNFPSNKNGFPAGLEERTSTFTGLLACGE